MGRSSAIRSGEQRCSTYEAAGAGIMSRVSAILGLRGHSEMTHKTEAPTARKRGCRVSFRSKLVASRRRLPPGPTMARPTMSMPRSFAAAPMIAPTIVTRPPMTAVQRRPRRSQMMGNTGRTTSDGKYEDAEMMPSLLPAGCPKASFHVDMAWRPFM